MKTIQDNQGGATSVARKPAPRGARSATRSAPAAKKEASRRGSPARKQAAPAPTVHAVTDAPVAHIEKSPKRKQGDSITTEFPGIGTVTLAPDQIAKAGAVWKTKFTPMLKQWEKHLKEDDNDRMRGFHVPKAPTFTEAVRFVGDMLKGTLFPVQATGAHKGKKPKKGGVDQSWRICRAAAIQWRRENGDFFKKEIDPVLKRILTMIRKTLETHVRPERLLTGDVKVRTYRNTVGVSANKANKRILEVA